MLIKLLYNLNCLQKQSSTDYGQVHYPSQSDYKPYPTQPAAPLQLTNAGTTSSGPPTVNKPPPSQNPGPDDYKSFDIVRATQYGVYERCLELVEGGYDVNQMDQENVSLLHWAAINNRLEIAK